MKNNGIISLQYSDYQYYLEIILSRSFRYFLRFVRKNVGKLYAYLYFRRAWLTRISRLLDFDD